MRTSRALPAVLLAFAAGHLLLGLLMAFAPGTFFEEIGPYPPQNDHYIRDLSTLYVALGAVALVAWRLPSWRLPVIAFALIQYALHAVNHLIDIGDTDPDALGPVNFATIALTVAALGWMLRESRKGEPR